MTNHIFNSYPIAFFLLLDLFGPIGKELTIRGLFFNYFLKSDTLTSQIITLVTSSLLFMLLHGSLLDVQALSYLAAGLILGSIYLLTRNLQYGIFTHIMMNLAATIFGI